MHTRTATWVSTDDGRLSHRNNAMMAYDVSSTHSTEPGACAAIQLGVSD